MNTEANKSVIILISFSSKIYVLITYAIPFEIAIEEASNRSLGIRPLDFQSNFIIMSELNLKNSK